MSKQRLATSVLLRKLFKQPAVINCGKLLFLAGWGLALGACMNEASTQELVSHTHFIASFFIS